MIYRLGIAGLDSGTVVVQTLGQNSVCLECHLAHAPSSFQLKFYETQRYCLVFLVSKLIVQTLSRNLSNRISFFQTQILVLPSCVIQSSSFGSAFSRTRSQFCGSGWFSTVKNSSSTNKQITKTSQKHELAPSNRAQGT